MHLANYLGYLQRGELDLADGFRRVGEAHAQEVDVYHLGHTLAKQCETHAEQLEPFVDRYGEQSLRSPSSSTTSSSTRPGAALWGFCATCTTCT